MKSVKVFASIIVGLLIITGIFLYLNFGDLAKNAAEKIATNALGVKVSISALDISLQDKKVTLSGLRIANPPGYQNASIITASAINVGLNTASKELIDFNDITVDGVVVNLEVTPNGTNLGDLKKLSQSKKQKESTGSEAVRVIVRNMVINSSTVNPSVTLLGRDVGSIQIPPVRIRGIGVRENGALAKDAVTQIVTQYVKAAEAQSSKAGLLGNAVKDATKQIETEVNKAVDDVGKSLKGLFQ